MKPENWQKNGEQTGQTLCKFYACKHHTIANLWWPGYYASKP